MKTTLITPNYCATVIEVKTLMPLDNCDNLVWLPVFGYTCIVSKDVKVWDIGIVFTAEVSLSDDYCKENNLYRHSELNKNPEQKWYVEDHRRVKAMKFRGNKSSALFMPLSSLSYLWISENELSIWDSFNEIDWKEICSKFIPVFIGGKNKLRGVNKKFERIDCKTFPEHVETENYFRNSGKYRNEDWITITQKLHGTSGRFWYVKVRRKLRLLERLMKKLWVNISEIEYDYIAGSRKVIKDAKVDREFSHFYKSDVWNDKLETIKWSIPKDYIIYWEIIWWVWEAPIQKWYTYRIPKWENELYVYRIAIVNDDGISTDLDYYTMREFCVANGLKYVPLLWDGLHWDFDANQRIDIKFHETPLVHSEDRDRPLQLDDESPCDEWVVVRKDWLTPFLTKAKSPLFYEFESANLDKWEVDIEQEQSLSDNPIEW